MWHLSGTVARYVTPAFETVLNVAAPWDGLTQLKYRGEPTGLTSILQADVRELIAAEQSLSEVYIRGRDLVATYVPSANRPVRIQIYWRAVQANELAGMELILSAQTDLLDSNPQVQTQSPLPNGECLQWDGEQANFRSATREPSTLFLIRPTRARFSYCEMIHSADFAGVALKQSPDYLSWTLFPERLEKGVIRRARMCGLFIPREDDRELAVAAQHQFEAEPLPLTT